jgi:SAM-dependent methyltransferase
MPNPFSSFLGGSEMASFDASPYEGGTVVHDMNLSIPDGYRNAFDTVLDGGSLEHTFNFLVAIKNCMQMVRVGGHFLGISPADNFFGHGFYQFSAELFYRVFCEENGFIVERMLVYEDFPFAEFYEVTDPKDLKQRVEMKTTSATFIFVCARKIRDTKVFASPPQQSDYSSMWSYQPLSRAPATAVAQHPAKSLARAALELLKCLPHITRMSFISRRPGAIVQSHKQRLSSLLQ